MYNMQLQFFQRRIGVAGSQTDGCNKVDDDEGVQHGDDGCADGSDDVAQALEPPEEAEDSESPKYLRCTAGQFGELRWGIKKRF